jgi:hypothetical protein
MRLEEFLGWKYKQNRWTGNPDEIGAGITKRLFKTVRNREKFVKLSDNSGGNLLIDACYGRSGNILMHKSR